MFKKKEKSQVIKFEQNICNASVNDNSVLFVRVSDIVTTSEALVEVPFTHNAFLIKGGGDCRFYKSGTYTVFDNKDEIKQWKKGVSVDVVYMPKDTSVTILWGTPNKVEYRDTVSNYVIEVGARGQFGITIINHEQFLRKVVGVRKEFDLVDFSKRFSAAVVDEFADCFLTVVANQNLIYDKFDANRKKIASKVGEILSEKFADSWGIGLVDFTIVKFEISQEDKNKVESVAEELRKEQEEIKREAKFREYLAELERLDDKQWEREKYLKQLEQEDNIAYYEVLKAIGKKDASEKAKGANFCPKCGHSCETTSEFCPNCGNRLGKSSVICPQCNKVNVDSATFCSGCGKKLK